MTRLEPALLHDLPVFGDRDTSGQDQFFSFVSGEVVGELHVHIQHFSHGLFMFDVDLIPVEMDRCPDSLGRVPFLVNAGADLFETEVKHEKTALSFPNAAPLQLRQREQGRVRFRRIDLKGVLAQHLELGGVTRLGQVFGEHGAEIAHCRVLGVDHVRGHVQAVRCA